MKLRTVMPALAAAFLSGCGLFWDDPYVAVTESPLNWVEIHYYDATREPIRRVNLRINGAGFVEVKSGTSRLVSDSFAKDASADEWDDIRERRINVDPGYVKERFQELVNADLFNKDKWGKSDREISAGRFIAVRAAIDNRTYSEPKNQYEDDPELAELLYNLVLEYRGPMLGAAKGR